MSKYEEEFSRLLKELEDLGEASRRCLVRDDLADRDVEDALAAEAWLSHDLLVGAVAANDFFDLVAAEGTPLQIRRWGDRKEVVAVELARGRGSVAVAGEVVREDGRYLFPAERPGIVRFTTSEGVFEVKVFRGLVVVDEVLMGGAEEVAPGPIPAPVADVAAPAVSEVFPGAILDGLSQGVRSRVGRLGVSPSTLDRAEALGLVVRLWEPPRGGAAAAVAAALRGDPSDPVVALKSWLATAPPELIDGWRFHAEAEAGELLYELAVGGHPEGEDDRITLGLRRDRLESALWVLSSAGLGDDLRELLKGLDGGRGGAVVAMSLPDPQLRAAQRSDPAAWWAAVVAEEGP